jgi:hypothetical protein
MKAMPSKSQALLKGLVEINFYVSVVVLIAGGVLSISEDASLFEFNVDLYGPLGEQSTDDIGLSGFNRSFSLRRMLFIEY